MKTVYIIFLSVILLLMLIPPHLEAEFVTQPKDKLCSAADIGMAVESGRQLSPGRRWSG